jgi:aldehyde dehydrogenase (NAD+)
VITREDFYIGGAWVASASGETTNVVSPSTEEVVGAVPVSVPADIDRAVEAARRAFDVGPWPRMSVADRAGYVAAIAELFSNRIDEAVDVQIDEMGGTRSFLDPVTRAALAGIGAAIGLAAELGTRELRQVGSSKVMVIRDPIGVVAGIVPWNAPIAVVFTKIVPALLAGCPIVIKPAPESPLSAYLVAEAAAEAGLPEGVLSIIPGGREVGEHLVSQSGIDRVAFTGSSAAGARVAAICGEQLKSVTLELGGKSAAIVLDDADLDRDMDALIRSSLPNTGQVCFATTRVLVPRSRSAEVVERLVDRVGRLEIGDPHRASTFFGPLAAPRQRDRVEAYIRCGLDEGAMVVLGGGRPAGLDKGWYVQPTIFTGVNNGMRIAREEIFGPVVCVIEYGNEEEAVAIANDSEYGLGGAVFTADVARGLDVAARLQTGTCQINQCPAGGGGGPFGGVKRSGIGREKSREGIESYYELKSVPLPVGYDPAA